MKRNPVLHLFAEKMLKNRRRLLLLPGVSMGLGLGQHHTSLGTARQSAESGGRAALEQSMMFKPQSRDSERAKP